MSARWLRVGPAMALAVALAVGGGLALLDDGGTGSTADRPSAEDEVAEITSDAPRFERLEELVGASDLVVQGTISATEPGRVFGQPGRAAVRSRLVTVTVDEVLHGGADGPAPGRSIIVEEPGWLDDGRPVEVDGVPGSTAGTTVIWFLQAVAPVTGDGGSGPATYVLTGPQGHYVVGDGELRGPSGADGLSDQLAGMGRDGLARAIRSVVPSPAP